MKTRLQSLLIGLALIASATVAPAQTTAFTYQGRLNDGTGPANGTYHLRFALFDALTVGNQVGAPLTNLPVNVSNGLFTVTLDFGAGVFPGADRWLEIGVRSNGGGAFTSLLPRQPITATPYAITAGNLSVALPSANLSGTYWNPVILSNAANSFSGNGANLTALNGSQLTIGTVPAAALGNAWRIDGNAGTTPGPHFLGTTDYQPLEFKVNGARALRLEPGSANLIGGAPGNFVAVNRVSSTIAGGGNANYINRIDADASAIGGGAGNAILGSANQSTIAGGFNNSIAPGAYGSAIAGGSNNRVSSNSYASVISGGEINTISPNATYATIAGGYWNNIGVNSAYSAIGGGSDNNIAANSLYATIPGGENNAATSYAFAAGRLAKANHTGAFVWADSTAASFASTAANQFLIRAGGGVGINTTTPNGATLAVNGTARIQGANNWDVNNGEGDFRVGNDVHRFKIGVSTGGGGAGDVWMRAQGGTARVFIKTPGGTTFYSNEGQTTGVSLAAGGGSWTALSDRNTKENFAPVNAIEVLEKVAALPLSTWNYKAQEDRIRHLGPMAQDFKAAFGLGETDTGITTVDADGVALAAIQGLNQKVEERSQKLEAENAELKQRLEKLERLMNHKNGGAK